MKKIEVRPLKCDAEMLNINIALKDMVEHIMIVNDDENIPTNSLISMSIDALYEDEIYGPLVNKDEANAYLQKIATAVEEEGSSFYDINIRECEICSECGLVLLPEDEYYESHNTKALCDSCSYYCEACGEYFTKSEVQESHHGYCCKACSKEPIELTKLP